MSAPNARLLPMVATGELNPLLPFGLCRTFSASKCPTGGKARPEGAGERTASAMARRNWANGI